MWNNPYHPMQTRQQRRWMRQQQMPRMGLTPGPAAKICPVHAPCRDAQGNCIPCQVGEPPHGQSPWPQPGWAPPPRQPPPPPPWGPQGWVPPRPGPPPRPQPPRSGNPTSHEGPCWFGEEDKGCITLSPKGLGWPWTCWCPPPPSTAKGMAQAAAKGGVQGGADPGAYPSRRGRRGRPTPHFRCAEGYYLCETNAGWTCCKEGGGGEGGGPPPWPKLPFPIRPKSPFRGRALPSWTKSRGQNPPKLDPCKAKCFQQTIKLSPLYEGFEEDLAWWYAKCNEFCDLKPHQKEIATKKKKRQALRGRRRNPPPAPTKPSKTFEQCMQLMCVRPKVGDSDEAWEDYLSCVDYCDLDPWVQQIATAKKKKRQALRRRRASARRQRRGLLSFFGL